MAAVKGWCGCGWKEAVGLDTGGGGGGGCRQRDRQFFRSHEQAVVRAGGATMEGRPRRGWMVAVGMSGGGGEGTLGHHNAVCLEMFHCGNACFLL